MKFIRIKPKSFLFIFFSLSFSAALWAGDFSRSVMLQGFSWTSCRGGNWWKTLESRAGEISSSGFDIIWLPPPQDSLSCEGYMPRELYSLDSAYGSRKELAGLLSSLNSKGITVIADMVLNHRVGTKDWADFTNPEWGPDSVCSDDEWGKGLGAKDTGKGFHAARDIDHTKKYVRDDLIAWMNRLKSMGFGGWRYDYARGFAPRYFRIYDDAASSAFSVAEIWDDLDISNPNAHRQALCDWMDATGGKIKVFDFTTKGLLQDAVRNNRFWRLRDSQGLPAGLIGWWPGNAVTFIDNHDTAERNAGSAHKSWPFPEDKILMGYAYILTHPGIPCVFWSHFSNPGMKDGIKKLIRIRKKYGINSTSRVYIIKASAESYVARIDDKLILKLGPGHWFPDYGWTELDSGYGYKIWGR